MVDTLAVTAVPTSAPCKTTCADWSIEARLVKLSFKTRLPWSLLVPASRKGTSEVIARRVVAEADGAAGNDARVQSPSPKP